MSLPNVKVERRPVSKLFTYTALAALAPPYVSLSILPDSSIEVWIADTSRSALISCLESFSASCAASLVVLPSIDMSPFTTRSPALTSPKPVPLNFEDTSPSVLPLLASSGVIVAVLSARGKIPNRLALYEISEPCFSSEGAASLTLFGAVVALSTAGSSIPFFVSCCGAGWTSLPAAVDSGDCSLEAEASSAGSELFATLLSSTMTSDGVATAARSKVRSFAECLSDAGMLSGTTASSLEADSAVCSSGSDAAGCSPGAEDTVCSSGADSAA